MDQKTSAALEASIAHWERNAAANTSGDVSVRAADCALCSVYRVRNKLPCEGCPVALKVGQRFCEGTPYQTAYYAFLQWVKDGSSHALFRAAAQTEVDFLKSLREP